MQYIKIFVSAVLILSTLFSMPTARALDGPKVVISQLQTGGSGTGTAGQEFVELYNNTSQDSDITDWCVTYSSASDGTPSTLGCFAAPDTHTKIWLKAGSFVTLTSPDFQAANHYTGDGTFVYIGGMASTGGHVRVLDAAKTEIDKLAWGTATHPETAAATAPAGGKVLQRSTVSPGVLQDTDNNSADFSVLAPSLHTGGLYEVETIIDVCPNIDGAQATVPTGLVVDVTGNCVTPPPTDVCPNIDGIQTELPTGDLKDQQGNCMADACTNLDGLQAIVPDGYSSSVGLTCSPVDETIDITELLPNPAGSDTGNEFIEFYNPNAYSVDLTNYMLLVGLNFEKTYALPAHTVIHAGQYLALNNADIGYALVNTTSRVRLMTPAGRVTSETSTYSNPPDGQSWTYIDGTWQYTDQPTPNDVNLPMSVVNDDGPNPADVSSVCPAGKYRNPLTNRCRNIETDASVLAACDADQYRNPDTGRCRKVAVAATQTPCKEGQYRSEETNRCRNIVTASAELAPCKAGQERNPDTNRCRNAAAKSVPDAAFAVEPMKQGAKAFVGWWALGGVGTLALGYAGWEWRQEVVGGLRRFKGFSLRK
jgi:hypothetical protein